MSHLIYYMSYIQIKIGQYNGFFGQYNGFLILFNIIFWKCQIKTVALWQKASPPATAKALTKRIEENSILF